MILKLAMFGWMLLLNSYYIVYFHDVTLPQIKQIAKNCIFTIRSAYYEEWEHQHGRKLRMTNSVQSSSTSPIWRTIWKLCVLAKIKIHVWRALLGAIPCMGVLANRHMITSSQCPLCTADCESIKHALFLCPRVQEEWHILGLGHMVIEVCAAAYCEGGSALAELFLSRRNVQPYQQQHCQEHLTPGQYS